MTNSELVFKLNSFEAIEKKTILRHYYCFLENIKDFDKFYYLYQLDGSGKLKKSLVSFIKPTKNFFRLVMPSLEDEFYNLVFFQTINDIKYKCDIKDYLKTWYCKKNV